MRGLIPLALALALLFLGPGTAPTPPAPGRRPLDPVAPPGACPIDPDAPNAAGAQALCTGALNSRDPDVMLDAAQVLEDTGFEDAAEFLRAEAASLLTEADPGFDPCAELQGELNAARARQRDAEIRLSLATSPDEAVQLTAEVEFHKTAVQTVQTALDACRAAEAS